MFCSYPAQERSYLENQSTSHTNTIHLTSSKFLFGCNLAYFAMFEPQILQNFVKTLELSVVSLGMIFLRSAAETDIAFR